MCGTFHFYLGSYVCTDVLTDCRTGHLTHPLPPLAPCSKTASDPKWPRTDASGLYGSFLDQTNPIQVRAEEQVPKGAAAEDASNLLVGEERDQHDKEDGGIGRDASQ